MRIALPELMKCPPAWHGLIPQGRIVGASLVVADGVARPVLAECAYAIAFELEPPATFPPEVVAPDAVQAERREICGACEHNDGGVCRQCCGGVPVATLVRLAGSRCKREKWTAIQI